MRKQYLILGAIVLSSFFLFSGAKPANKSGKVVLKKTNYVVMDQEFSEESVARVLLKAKDVDFDLPANEPMYLVVNSPGGSIEAGLSLIDNLNTFDRPVHTITLFSASMGYQTVQGLGDRILTPSGTLMAHKAKGGFKGEFPGQIDSRYQFWLNRLKRMDKVVVDRSNGKIKSLKEYEAMYENEYWCDGESCVKAGVADRVAKVWCDSSLKGTETEPMKVNFMGLEFNLEVTKAACPTILGFLDIKVIRDNKKTNINATAELRQIPELSTMTAETLLQFQNYVKQKVDSATGRKNEVIRY